MRLATVDLSWREFNEYVIGLRTADTRLSRLLAKSADQGGEPS